MIARIFWWSYIALIVSGIAYCSHARADDLPYLGEPMDQSLHAPEHAAWKSYDTALAIGAATALAIDWAQTREARRMTPQPTESNPVLGGNPSFGRINTYFTTVFVVGGVAVAYSPPIVREGLMAGVILLEIDAINQNKSIGIKVRF
jgi:hypothetical protein